MRDILPPESGRWRRFTRVFAEVVEAAGYGEMITPLLEDIGVFTRIGDATDVVSKEMYDFVDKGERHISLRPEMTASVSRSFAQHRPTMPWKVFYAGSNFRYEKPQRGRYRQFDQVGIEVLGVDDPQLDVEVIALAWKFYRRLGLREVTLIVNSLGEPDERARYVEALRDYFLAAGDPLTEQSRATLERNPLRVLDSKREPDQAVIAGAPTITDYRGAASAAHFETCVDGLRASTSPSRSNRNSSADSTTTAAPSSSSRAARPTRRRTRSVAAAATTVSSRHSAARPPPAWGFPLGVDRTLLACDDEGVFAARRAPPRRVRRRTRGGGGEATVLTAALRNAGLTADRGYDNRSMKAQMKLANRSGASHAVIVGGDELAAGTVVVKPLRTDADQVAIDRARPDHPPRPKPTHLTATHSG